MRKKNAGMLFTSHTLATHPFPNHESPAFAEPPSLKLHPSLKFRMTSRRSRATVGNRITAFHYWFLTTDFCLFQTLDTRCRVLPLPSSPSALAFPWLLFAVYSPRDPRPGRLFHPGHPGLPMLAGAGSGSHKRDRIVRRPLLRCFFHDRPANDG